MESSEKFRLELSGRSSSSSDRVPLKRTTAGTVLSCRLLSLLDFRISRVLTIRFVRGLYAGIASTVLLQSAGVPVPGVEPEDKRWNLGVDIRGVQVTESLIRFGRRGVFEADLCRRRLRRGVLIISPAADGDIEVSSIVDALMGVDMAAGRDLDMIRVNRISGPRTRNSEDVRCV